MMAFTLLFSIIYISLCLESGYGSYMSTEESLRQNIADLLNRKLKFSGSNLPFDENELSDTTPKNQSTYDFIIIGAGSAGATIASRLSEVQDVTILLIEAGGKEYSIMDVPSMFPTLWSHNETDWNYRTESSDRYCLGTKDGKCFWPRGKAVGGSSVINGMNAIRGNRRDYDGWAADVGDDSWSYKSMLNYFRKLEDFDLKNVKFNEEFHSKGGPMHITDFRPRAEISKSFIEAGKELGYSQVDHNGREQVGFAYHQTAIYKGERWSVNRGYLRPAKNRTNLYLTRNSHVHKILIDKVTKVAYGVRYSKKGQIYEVMARNEIILSAGSINSPQIMMLSGIGPKKHPSDLNIDVVKDAPVGENLIDHIGYRRDLTFSVDDSSVLQNSDVLDDNDPSISNYLKYRNGSLSYGGSLSVIAHMNVDEFYNQHPNVHLVMSFADTLIRPKKSGNPTTFSIAVIILRPQSRGKILLRSNQPFDYPKIYPNYLEDLEDVKVLIKGIRTALKIGETRALKKHGSQYRHRSSTCDSYGVDSDEYWECELRHYATTLQHPVGTCKMGRVNSSSAVVDSQLKVIGVKRLRLADASIVPKPICAYMNIPVIAIGEKAADMIKKEHARKKVFTLNQRAHTEPRTECRAARVFTVLPHQQYDAWHSHRCFVRIESSPKSPRD